MDAHSKSKHMHTGTDVGVWEPGSFQFSCI